MNTSVTQQLYSLSIAREIHALREKVFKAWTEPTQLIKWFGPKDVTTTEAEIDLIPGGNYRFTMIEPDGQVISHGGEYREIHPPEKLVFTWVLEGQGCEGSEGLFAETLVTIEFQEMGTSTRLILTHDFLPNETSKAAHQMGWKGSLDALETMVG